MSRRLVKAITFEFKQMWL